MAESKNKEKEKQKDKPEHRNFELEARRAQIQKRSDMVQKGRFALNLVEHKAIDYIISKVGSSDMIGQTYTFDCEEFYRVIGWKKDSYTKLRAMISHLASQGWWLWNSQDNTGKYIHWFNIVHVEKGDKAESSKRYLKLSFSDDMNEYLLDLRGQMVRNGNYYIQTQLQYTALMKHMYSPRIYEILKSYQINRKEWTFEIGTGSEYDLQVMIATTKSKDKNHPEILTPSIPKSWSNFAVFNRDVLVWAKEEINAFTDLMIDYRPLKTDLRGRSCGRVASVRFMMVSKTKTEKEETENRITKEYDRISQESTRMKVDPDPDYEKRFFEARNERAEAEKRDELDKAINESRYPVVAGTLVNQYGYTVDEAVKLTDASFTKLPQGEVKLSCRELWATDYISYYAQKVALTGEATKTTAYRRLLDLVMHDYDDMASDFITDSIRYVPEQKKVSEPVEETDSEDMTIDEIDREIARLERLREKAAKKR